MAIKAILDTQVRINQIYLRQFSVPPMYELGRLGRLRYQEEPDDGIEEFAGIEPVLMRGWGDCDDLAPWRAAELREQGENAKIRVHWKKQPNGRKMFHVTVRRGDGTIEDPSRILGMK